MAVAAGDGGVAVTSPAEQVPAIRNQHWMLTVLPAFPLLLLLLRLWYLSRQNLQTMLLLVQDVSPLGLVSTLLITLVWTLPLVVLAGRALGALLLVSTTERGEVRRSWLLRASLRIPDWVVIVSIVLAALTWQLRFLPALLMVTLAIVGLEVRRRYPGHPRVVRTICVTLPLVAAVAAYAWLIPGIVEAIRGWQMATAALLILPPALTVFLTGPVPGWAARPVTHSAATFAILVSPFVVGAIFLQAPILPTVAIEIDSDPHDGRPPETVLIGHVINVNDRIHTVLDDHGKVLFVLNEQVMSETLCADDQQIPSIPVSVHGWQVEQTPLTWIAPTRRPTDTQPEPRCQGRPLHVP
jgi:hypothetical protein